MAALEILARCRKQICSQQRGPRDRRSGHCPRPARTIVIGV